jgi:TPR repeat protein/tRNA A-37 threonylcarbamoyl transferase component Bud32
MSLLSRLSSLALRPLLPGIARLAAEAADCALAKVGVDVVEKYLVSRFTDASQEVPKALARSADRAWVCLEIGLGGTMFLGSLRRRGEDKEFTAKVRAFLDTNPLELPPGQDERFRRQALAQLRAARKSGLIPGTEKPRSLAEQAAAFTCFSDPASLCDAEWQVLAEVAAQLRQAGHTELADVVALRPDSGQPPLLAVAVRLCFRSEVESNTQLFQGLVYEQVDGLRHDLAAGFDGLLVVLRQHRQEIETALSELLAVAEETRDHILDLKAEQAKQGEALQALYATMIRLCEKLDDLDKRPLRFSDSMSIRGKAELRLVREVLATYRALPEEQRRRLPELLAVVGRLEYATGDSRAALHDLQQQAQLVEAPAAKASAHHGAYLAALNQEDDWGTALTELLEAARLDPERYAPFPLLKYVPERILGTGGFGVVFLCRHHLSKAQLAVKALRTDQLDRDVATVLTEAVTLDQLSDPAIIRPRDCGFADAAGTRPYLVMDYFDGPTLEEHVRKDGPLPPEEVRAVARQLAAGLKAAHDLGILHRDVKPGNVLLRKTAAGWVVKIIDFGLAVRPQALQPTPSNADPLARTPGGKSMSGTIDYSSPEQLGRLKGVPTGSYSDVYSFGRTVCFAAFGTHQPLRRHWKEFSDEALADLLERCIEEQPNGRPGDFGEVLDELKKAPKAADDYADVLADFEEYLRVWRRNGTRPYLEQAAPQRIQRWRKAAEQGVAEAQVMLGDCYEQGLGAGQDYAEAMKWYRKAADLGNAVAMIQIGYLYCNGQGVGQDYAEAMKWYRKAADLGDAVAMVLVGSLYDSGRGVAQDYAEALKWYRKAIDLGSTVAMINIGVLYQEGWGVAQDYAEAMKWYRKAADLGEESAMNNIGFLYKDGLGVAQNYAEAMRWYRKAADLGDADAMFFVGLLYQYGHGDYVEALKWYRKAADLGVATAMGRIGMMYVEGQGVKQDKAEGKRWLSMAAERGNDQAKKNLEQYSAPGFWQRLFGG